MNNHRYVGVVILCFISCFSCKISNNSEEETIYDTYLGSFYSQENILISEGIVSVFKSDSMDSVGFEGFSDIVDSVNISQYISDKRVSCIIKNDSIEIIAAVLPDFGSFIVTGVYSNERLEGDWGLWGHLAKEDFGSFTAIKSD